MKRLLLAAASAIALLAAPSAIAATMQCQPLEQTQAVTASYTADAAGIVTGVAPNDINAMSQAGCAQLGVQSGLCGELLSANMNVATDQPFKWFVGPTQSYQLVKIIAKNASRSFAAGSAAGGIYTAASKGGVAVVAAAQAYTALTDTNATANLPLTLVAGVGTLGEYMGAPLIFSLTTADGTAGSIDLLAYCDLGN
jgi:hypothetical protein